VTKAAIGRLSNSAGRNLVKPEQASKVEMRTPTRPNNGEGSMVEEVIDMSTQSVRLGSGHSTLKRCSSEVREARLAGGQSPTPWKARRVKRESDRAVGALKPGNAGGAKGPDFWCAFEEVEDG
jgi:hypothetical protein